LLTPEEIMENLAKIPEEILERVVRKSLGKARDLGFGFRKCVSYSDRGAACVVTNKDSTTCLARYDSKLDKKSHMILLLEVCEVSMTSVHEHNKKKRDEYMQLVYESKRDLDRILDIAAEEME